MSIEFTAGVVVGLLVLLYVAFGVLLFVLAKRNILVTHVKEGTGISVMRGESLDDIFISRLGYHVNHPKWRETGDSRYDPTQPPWEILPNCVGVKYDDRSWLFRLLGIYWLGFVRTIYEYKFVWNEMQTSQSGPNKGKKEVRPRTATTNFAYIVPFPYVQIVDAAETADNLPMDGMYQLVMEITNIEKALHSTVDWLEITGSYSNRIARNYMGSRKIDQLRSETDDAAAPDDLSDSFSAPLIALTDKLPDEKKKRGMKTLGLRGKHGIAVRAGNLETIAPPGEIAAQVNEGLMRRYLSEQQAAEIRNIANAEADAILSKGRADNTIVSERGKADAKALMFRLAILRKGGELGKLIVQVDAMRAPAQGEKIIWAQMPFVHNKGLSELADSLGLTPERLAKLMKKVNTALDEEGV